MAAPARPRIEELTRRIDDILERKLAPKRTFGHALAVTEENVRRMFGITMWDLFLTLAEKFGYDVPDAEPPKTS
ncbi:MAG TPA: hypothetical protein VGR51_01745 [Thermoplasmata archaeon]|jgi:hypothetical protein|nr:hypothetical protein [Thermoplasmata archaeon]